MSAAGQVVPYTFTVTNTGNATLTGITVSDPKCGAPPALTVKVYGTTWPAALTDAVVDDFTTPSEGLPATGCSACW